MTLSVLWENFKTFPVLKNEASGSRGMKGMLQIPRRRWSENWKHTVPEEWIYHELVSQNSELISPYEHYRVVTECTVHKIWAGLIALLLAEVKMSAHSGHFLSLKPFSRVSSTTE